MYTESAPPDCTNKQPFWLPAPDGLPASNCSSKLAATSAAVASEQASGVPPAEAGVLEPDDGAVVVGFEALLESDEHEVTASERTRAATQRHTKRGIATTEGLGMLCRCVAALVLSLAVTSCSS